MNENEIRTLVSMSWNIADTIPLTGVPEGMYVKDPNKPGEQSFNSVRWNTYLYLLSALLPRAIAGNFSVTEPPEEWQKG